MQSLWQLLPCALIGVAILLLDILTKAYVGALSQQENSFLPIAIVSNFFGIDVHITYAINKGAAWGVFGDFPRLLVACRMILIAGLLVYLIAYNDQPSWNIPITCIISGAIGNVFDYFYYGHVIDMIQVRFWGYEYPVFNIADSAIFVGACWLLLLTFLQKKRA